MTRLTKQTLPTGIQGKSSYFFQAWATDTDGADFHLTDGTDKTFVGLYSNNNPVQSTDPSDYKWSPIMGDVGEEGGTKEQTTNVIDLLETPNWMPLNNNTVDFDDNGKCTSDSVISITVTVQYNSENYERITIPFFDDTVGSAMPKVVTDGEAADNLMYGYIFRARRKTANTISVTCVKMLEGRNHAWTDRRPSTCPEIGLVIGPLPPLTNQFHFGYFKILYKKN